MTKNVAASVKNKLLALSKERSEAFDLVLSRYAIERVLYRLSKSTHVNEFIVKGATLFVLWTGAPHRATRDLDLLGKGNSDMSRLATTFTEVLATEVEDDGLTFDDDVRASRIKEGAEYEGVRLQLVAHLGSARIPVQIDVGFGDAVTPAPRVTEFPTMLDASAPKLRAYAMETVVAEKLHAMVALDVANSRMKDFFDLWLLSRRFDFDGELLTRAVRVPYARRSSVATPTFRPKRRLRSPPTSSMHRGRTPSGLVS
ncbi:MAG: nucleotidyl transferase AbiEii/AbiGii toxin family protein [Archangium sp.]